LAVANIFGNDDALLDASSCWHIHIFIERAACLVAKLVKLIMKFSSQF
jgi:hypothetical protein